MDALSVAIRRPFLSVRVFDVLVVAAYCAMRLVFCDTGWLGTRMQ